MSRYFYYRILLGFSALVSLCVIGIGIQGSSDYHLDLAQVTDCVDRKTITLEYQLENITSRQMFRTDKLCPKNKEARIWVSLEKYDQGDPNWWCWELFEGCLVSGYITMIILGSIIVLINLIFMMVITPVRELVPSSLELGESFE